MRKIMLVGDFESDNGPGNANKEILHAVDSIAEIQYSKQSSKLKRILEVFKMAIWAEVCICCSASKLNYFLFWICKVMGTKIIYVMHGYGSFEYLINGGCKEDKLYRQLKKYEQFVFSKTDKIVCVSKKFMNDMKKKLPTFACKFEYIFNVVHIKDMVLEIENNILHKKDNCLYVLTLGGGMHRKRNLVVAKAIENINRHSLKKIRFVVVGSIMQEGESLKGYDFVDYFEQLPHIQVLKLMKECDLFIQNSEYETFGLAIIEALLNGSNLLISKNVGCIDLFEKLDDMDVVVNIEDEEEIENKIIYNLKNSNNNRLLKDFKRESITQEAMSKKLKLILDQI